MTGLREDGRDVSLAGRRVVVTGGTSGIGAGTARVLAARGADVVVAGRSAERGDALAREIDPKGASARFVRCDVSDDNEVQSLMDAAAEWMGGIDGLVCAAGIGVYEPIDEVSLDDLDGILRVNLRGLMLCVRHALPRMRAAGGGAIVAVSSVHADQASPGDAPYAATKGGIDAFVRSTALDVAPDIRVNAIHPGWIMTSLTEGLFEELAPEGRDADAAKRAIASAQPMRRLGRPEDVGMAAAYLLSDDAAFVTGTTLTVDGGLTARLERWTPDRVKLELAHDGR